MHYDRIYLRYTYIVYCYVGKWRINNVNSFFCFGLLAYNRVVVLVYLFYHYFIYYADHSEVKICINYANLVCVHYRAVILVLIFVLYFFVFFVNLATWLLYVSKLTSCGQE